ncbi:MAG: ATP-binding protein [Bacteroidales bacterium]|nr:ATP-binding protein [Bacteroidales bacterium]
MQKSFTGQQYFEILLQNHNVKLITGPRRVGKSTQALLILKNKNFAYLNFDDNNLLEKWDEELVMHILNDIYPNYEYLLLDEVQNVPGWDIWVSKLYRRGINMVITGSNANMLSGEMATLLTGRYLEINMLPFSLKETLEWEKVELSKTDTSQLSQVESIREEYLRLGGYPESVALRAITRSYLSSLFDSIIYKDVVKRHKVRNVTDLNNIAHYLLSNFCNTLSYNDVSADLGLSSVATTKKFMDYLREPYLFYYLPRYNNKLKLMKKAPQKVYVVDNGFVAAKAFNLSENLGRLLENLVFVELIRRGYNTENSLFYYRSRNNKETDFVTRNGTRIEALIQVCYDMTNEKTKKREIDSIIECAEELKCENLIIVTACDHRTVESKGHTIKIVPITKF